MTSSYEGGGAVSTLGGGTAGLAAGGGTACGADGRGGRRASLAIGSAGVCDL